jgi:hypothetical protein
MEEGAYVGTFFIGNDKIVKSNGRIWGWTRWEHRGGIDHQCSPWEL